MEELREKILETKPNLSESSVKRYSGCLMMLFKNIWKDKPFDYHKFFKDSDDVFDYLKNVPYNTRKTKIASIISVSKGESETTLKKYQDMMIKDCKTYNTHEKEHKLSPKDSWMTWDEIVSVHQSMEKKLKKQKEKNPYEWFEYLVLSLYVLIKPRRSQDFTEMKITGKTGNYYDGKNFHFAIYKTSKKYGTQIIPVPPKLKSIIDKWITMLPKGTEYLLTYQDKKLTVQRLTQLFNSMFKKGISVNVLRHAYITQELAPAIEKLEKIASEMGHSTAQQSDYRKS